jgi:hypothetical protein
MTEICQAALLRSAEKFGGAVAQLRLNL